MTSPARAAVDDALLASTQAYRMAQLLDALEAEQYQRGWNAAHEPDGGTTIHSGDGTHETIPPGPGDCRTCGKPVLWEQSYARGGYGAGDPRNAPLHMDPEDCG